MGKKCKCACVAAMALDPSLPPSFSSTRPVTHVPEHPLCPAVDEELAVVAEVAHAPRAAVPDPVGQEAHVAEDAVQRGVGRLRVVVVLQPHVDLLLAAGWGMRAVGEREGEVMSEGRGR